MCYKLLIKLQEKTEFIYHVYLDKYTSHSVNVQHRQVKYKWNYNHKSIGLKPNFKNTDHHIM